MHGLIAEIPPKVDHTTFLNRSCNRNSPPISRRPRNVPFPQLEHYKALEGALTNNYLPSRMDHANKYLPSISNGPHYVMKGVVTEIPLTF